MKEKIVVVNNHKISTYYSDYNNNSSHRVVFLHGNSLSAKIFENQFNSDILGGFELIAIELPGHGNSSKFTGFDQKYSYSHLVELLITLINQLDIADSFFVGNSLSGNLLFEILPDLKPIKGIMVNGAPPFNIPFNPQLMVLPSPDSMLFSKGPLTDGEITAMASLLLTENSIYEPFINSIIKNCDENFRSDLLKSVIFGDFSNQVDKINNTNIPLCIFNGESEKICNIQYIIDCVAPARLYKNKIHHIKNSSHLPFLENPKVFNELLRDFVVTNSN